MYYQKVRNFTYSEIQINVKFDLQYFNIIQTTSLFKSLTSSKIEEVSSHTEINQSSKKSNSISKTLISCQPDFTIFKQPIDYCKNTHLIDNHIKSDLELLKSETNESNSVYNTLLFGIGPNLAFAGYSKI